MIKTDYLNFLNFKFYYIDFSNNNQNVDKINTKIIIVYKLVIL